MELTRRERNKQQCRARILKASRRLFSTKGYEQTTIEDVAEKAEISKATLYNYFTSKESLLLGIAEAELEDIQELTETEFQTEPSAVVKLKKVLRCFVLDSITYIGLCRKITCLNSSPESELYPTRVRMLALLRELVEEGQRGGELRPDVAAGDIVDLLMGVYLVSQFQWTEISGYTAAECVRRLDHFFDLAMGSVLV